MIYIFFIVNPQESTEIEVLEALPPSMRPCRAISKVWEEFSLVKRLDAQGGWMNFSRFNTITLQNVPDEVRKSNMSCPVHIYLFLLASAVVKYT